MPRVFHRAARRQPVLRPKTWTTPARKGGQSTVEAGRRIFMEHLSRDFDVLAERADECGAMWAVRKWRRLAADGIALPRDWPGTIEEARRLVDTFAERVGFAERENLASIVQYTAEWTWGDSIGALRPSGVGLAGPPPPERGPSFSWHLSKLSGP